MALTNAYVQIYGQLPDFFRKISEGQAPKQLTTQLLKDLGFGSTNHRALIPLLKELGFLSSDGTPTARYHEYRDKSQSRRVMAEAIREAYADLFVINASPSESDRTLIEGKFKSTNNVSDRISKLMANTFFALVGLADLQARKDTDTRDRESAETDKESPREVEISKLPTAPTLHYNIQIHLPATKDVEVYNAIFKSLREHLIK